jgi:16S rRNA (cytosine967-C5)-methyltransferase
MSMYLDADAQRRVLEIDAEVGRPRVFLADVIEQVFRRERVPSSQKGRVVETARDMVRWRRKAEWLCAPDISPLSRLACTLCMTGRIAPDEARMLAPQLDVERVLNVDALLENEQDSVMRLGLQHSLPDWLTALLIQELGAPRAGQVAESLNQTPPQTFRVNTLLTTRELVLALFRADGLDAHFTQSSDVGITLRTWADVFATTAFHEGFMEVQDEASQLVAQLVAPPPNGTVIDWCAGAGGKTLALGAMLQGKGRIIAMDVNNKRLDELRRRVRRAGLSNVQAMNTRERSPGEQLLADRVLVDAPCSGLGALRRNPEARWHIKREDLERLAEQQYALAVDGLQHVKVGGRLIFATCSFLRMEGEAVVERLRQAHPSLQPVRVREVLGGARTQGLTDDNGWYLRTWPDAHGMDGFFAAVFRQT